MGIKLVKDYPQIKEVRGCMDLNHFAGTRCLPEEPDKRSLDGLARAVLRESVAKELRKVDWERCPLDKPCQQYAALDAQISLRIWEKLLTFPQKPPPVAADKENQPGAGKKGKRGLAAAGTGAKAQAQGHEEVQKAASKYSIGNAAAWFRRIRKRDALRRAPEFASLFDSPLPQAAEREALAGAKLQAHEMHLQGRSVKEIAAERKIKESMGEAPVPRGVSLRCRQMESKRTDAVAPAALNYLSAAIEAGQPYLWDGFSVPKLAVRAIANAALAASVADEYDESLSANKIISNGLHQEVPYGQVRLVVLHAARVAAAIKEEDVASTLEELPSQVLPTQPIVAGPPVGLILSSDRDADTPMPVQLEGVAPQRAPAAGPGRHGRPLTDARQPQNLGPILQELVEPNNGAVGD